jgi:alpha-galactosidase
MIADGDNEILCLFNWSDSNSSLEVKLNDPCQVTDYWTGEELGNQMQDITLKDIAPHSSKMLVCQKI